MPKKTNYRDWPLSLDLVDWFETEDEVMTYEGTARFRPHVYIVKDAELSRQKLRAWIDRDWCWHAREHDPRGVPRGSFGLTEKGVERWRVARTASDDKPPGSDRRDDG